MPKIVKVHAREILDSRGKPTVEAEVHLEGGIVGRASVPSGASTGAAEACELRDGDAARYDGLGVRRAVENVDPRASARRSSVMDAVGSVGDRPADDRPRRHAQQIAAGSERDPGRLAGSSRRSGALSKQVPLYRHLRRAVRHAKPRLPLPMVNMISGGKHAGGNLDFQDVLIMPVGAPDYPTRPGMDRPRLSPAGKAAERGRLRRLPRRRRRGLWPAAEIEPRGGRVRRAGDRSGRTCGPASDVTIALDVAAIAFLSRRRLLPGGRARAEAHRAAR